jgi:dUTP pyrophosphatase
MNNTEQMIPAIIRDSGYVLKIFVPMEYETLRAFYRGRIQDHNAKIYDSFPDSGFDLGLSKDIDLVKTCSNKISLGVHCAMFSNDQRQIPQAYYLYPRSSIVKTPIRMSNSVGIIDSGYRGEITAFVDMIDTTRNSFSCSAMDRYFQICHPSLHIFKVILVDSLEELGTTCRGARGFGSTGR